MFLLQSKLHNILNFFFVDADLFSFFAKLQLIIYLRIQTNTLIKLFLMFIYCLAKVTDISVLNENNCDNQSKQ